MVDFAYILHNFIFRRIVIGNRPESTLNETLTSVAVSPRVRA